MEMKNVKEIIIPNPDYELLEYIDLPSGCRISLNENGNANTAYYIDANWNLNNDTISNAECPFGSIYISGSNYYRYHLATNSNINMQACSGNSTYTTLFSATTSARHVIELNYHTYNDKKAYCDDVEKGTFSPTSGTNTGYLRIGGRLVNNGGTLSYNTYSGTIRLYEMKSKTSANGLSIFYPVKRKSDNKIGLFKVYNKGEAVRFCVTETEVEPVAGPLSSQNIDLPVKKITNSNGDIIWGSQAAYPYRRLEYIHFNGAERVQTNFYAGTTTINHQSEFTLDSMPTSDCYYIAINDQTLNNNLARLYMPQGNATGLHVNIGNTWSGYASSTPVNTKLKFSATVGKDGSNKPRVYFYLINQSTGTTILSLNPLTGSTAGDLNTNKVLSIGCGRYITSSNDTYTGY